MLLIRYLAMQAAKATAAVLGAILLLLFLFALIQGPGGDPTGKATIWTTLLSTLSMTLSMSLDVLPIAALLGVVIGIGALAGHAELIAMRAGGFGALSIGSSVMLGVIAVVGLGFFCGDVLAPRLGANLPSSQQQPVSLRDGSTVLTIGTVLSSTNLLKLRFLELDERWDVPRIAMAKAAHFQHGQCILDGLDETIFHADGSTSTRHSDTTVWKTTIAPDVLAYFAVTPEQLSTISLWRYLRYLAANHQDTYAFRLALWERLTIPLHACALALLAVAFVFGPLRSVHRAQRILAGCLLGVAFHFAVKMLFGFGQVMRLPVMGFALVPTLFLLGGSLFVLRRLR
jgi:lipopolysaccharide export system permease protein